MKSYYWPLLALLLLIVGRPVHADVVAQAVAPGINAKAEYLRGEADQPLLIFMHGFLQTYQFSTVKRLSEALHESGYSTLSPTSRWQSTSECKACPVRPFTCMR